MTDAGWRELTAQKGIFAQVWEAGSRVFAGDRRCGADGPRDPVRALMRQVRRVFMQLEPGMVRASLARRKPARGARRRPSACCWRLTAGHL